MNEEETQKHLGDELDMSFDEIESFLNQKLEKVKALAAKKKIKSDYVTKDISQFEIFKHYEKIGKLTFKMLVELCVLTKIMRSNNFDANSKKIYNNEYLNRTYDYSKEITAEDVVNLMKKYDIYDKYFLSDTKNLFTYKMILDLRILRTQYNQLKK